MRQVFTSLMAGEGRGALHQRLAAIATLVAVLWPPAVLRAQAAPLVGEPRILFEHSTRVLRAVLTGDGRTLYFCDLPPDNLASAGIWEATRETLDQEFGRPARRLGPTVNRGPFTLFPYLSPDDRLLYFSVGHLPEDGRLFAARRSPEGEIGEVLPLDVGRTAYMGCVSPDSRELYFVSGPYGDRWIWRAQFNVPGDPQSGFHTIERLAGLNTAADEWPPSISPDGRVLLWSHRPWAQSPPPPGQGGADLWMATRASPGPEAPFGAPVNLPSPPNSSGDEAFPFLWADGRTLLFLKLDARIWQADAACLHLDPDIAAAFTISDDPAVGEEVILDAAASAVPDGAVVFYEWWLGDGEEAEGVQVSHRYEAPGRYRVTLIVRSDQGTCHHRSEMVTVTCRSGGTPGWTSAAVGEPAFPGSARFEGEGEDRCLAACAGGSGLYGSSDGFHYVCREVSGDITLRARVAEAASAGQTARVGVMLRASLDAGSRYASALVEVRPAGSSRFRLLWREESDGRTFLKSGEDAELPLAWVEIRREGREVVALASADGVEWTELRPDGGRVALDLPVGVLAGVAVAGAERSPEQPYRAVTARVCDLSLEETSRFLRGDCNQDGRVDLSDAVRDWRFCFSGQSVPCTAACDADGDGNPCSGVTDGLRILMYLFRGGAPPPPPFPECGRVEPGVHCATPPADCP